MLYCEECRGKKNWPRPMTYPFHQMSFERCEVCSRDRECYSVPALFLRPHKTVEEIMLSKKIQHEYQKKAEDLVITYVFGPNTGRVDHTATEELQKTFTKVNDQIDWYGTYELRKSIQEGYRRYAELKR